ncbi:alpha/beta hydrolase [Verrucomicrobiales bacterium]|jgi:phospholipase/carboxylesterase|nr:alpha/beta hydrolase [Verrucomicrobiales bacterium]MDC0502989.1 alpha/beta hydrolase [Verrucomicrobiales bacterium]MDF1787707.1 alpha/beta fold hydrolase [Verrucomicrobiales bacterium]
MESLPCLEIGATRDEAELVVLLMHGLGADAHDFRDVAQALCQAAQPSRWRFVLPNAPSIPVTINGGMSMPAWYDILDLSHPRAVNWDTVDDSAKAIQEILLAEMAPTVVLAGFSQGAAMALHIGLGHASRVHGILMMSGYLLESEERPCPPATEARPIGLFHGTEDSMVPLAAAERTVEALTEAGHRPSLKPYAGMEHSVCDEEVRDVFAWLCGLP